MYIKGMPFVDEVFSPIPTYTYTGDGTTVVAALSNVQAGTGTLNGNTIYLVREVAGGVRVFRESIPQQGGIPLSAYYYHNAFGGTISFTLTITGGG
jgi:hypothetical protein